LFRKHHPIAADKIIPDPQDFDADMIVETEQGRTAAYRMAQARKLNRLFERWKAEQN
jgi:hypothetical protein